MPRKKNDYPGERERHKVEGSERDTKRQRPPGAKSIAPSVSPHIIRHSILKEAPIPSEKKVGDHCFKGPLGQHRM